MNKKTFRKVGFRLIHGCFILCLANLFAVTTVAQDNHNLFDTHYFPQFADGKFDDGTYYKSKLMINPKTDSTSMTCVLEFYGMSNPTLISDNNPELVRNTHRVNIAMQRELTGFFGAFIASTPGTQPFQSGYAKLTCDDTVFANVVFSFWSATGVKLSEATVFSSPSSYLSHQLIFDQTENARIGVAIANISEVPVSFTIRLRDTSGVTQASGETAVFPGQTASAKFIDELITVPSDLQQGLLTIGSTWHSSIIGLRYTGTAFTTIPATCSYKKSGVYITCPHP